MKVGSLFSGIGGLDLAVGGTHAWMCEQDPSCQRILRERFPGVPIFDDVRDLGRRVTFGQSVDILVGGYPCQPFSVAGKREGENDPRHLWPEFARLVRVLRPRVVVAENVAGHLRLGFHAVLADLAALGMDVRWGVVRASDVGAPHQRARLFVVATDPDRSDGRRWGEVGWLPAAPRPGDSPHPSTDPLQPRAGRDAGAVPGAEEPSGQRQPDDGEREPVSDAHGGAPADAYGRRREQRDARVGRVPVASENGSRALADTEDAGPSRAGSGSVRPTAGRMGCRPSVGGQEVAPDADEAGRREYGGSVAARAEHAAAERRSIEVPADAERPEQPRIRDAEGSPGGHDGGVAWGVYADAVHRWEYVLGRPAPRPTDDRGRLMPEFVEWMMGFPDGWTAGVSRTQRLKMLGNAVVPQQAALALELL